MRAIIYSRVSTDAQERDGTSLETQERACSEFVASHGWTEVEAIRDAASGFSLERPGIDRIRQLLRTGAADVVVAYAVDRLSRNQNQIGVLFDEAQTAGARLEFVTEKFEDTAIGRFILAARAFIGEVEREKIAERTMRGKAERARSGRLPQATGKGIYGYTYDAITGRRAINANQAAVVTRIFAEFCDGRSCNGIAATLNAGRIPALGGGRWHPLTVRRILANRTYTGRTTYRRTRVDSVRDPATGRKRRRVTERPSAEWIEIDGCTPSIVASALFEEAQKLLNDPARRLRGQPTAEYRLRGRARCLDCGTPMVGQALGRGQYRYYRCRLSYAGPGSGSATCSARYVPVQLLEQAVLGAVAAVIADPERILAEARHFNRSVNEEPSRRAALRKEHADVEAEQRRLVRLYTTGAMPDGLLREESDRLNQLRQRLESELRELETARAPMINVERLRASLPSVTRRLQQFVTRGEPGDFALLFRALDVQVAASRERVEIRGVVPVLESPPRGSNQDLVTIERTSA